MNTLQYFIENYGIYAMLIMVMLEYACFPVSSELILPLFGIYIRLNHIPFVPALIISSICGLAGTYIIFLLSEKLINTKMLAPFCQSDTYKKAKKTCEKYGAPAVLISRVIPLLRTYVAFAAGINGISHCRYLCWSFAGILLWNTVLIGIGYINACALSEVSSYYTLYKYILLFVLAVIMLSYSLKNIFKKCC